MTAGLAGRRALVTGGAVRLGRTLALSLAGMGLDVAVHYRSSAAEAEGTAAECRARGVRAVTVAGDLGRADECRRVVAESEGALGGVDVLVNSASNFLSAPFEETTDMPEGARMSLVTSARVGT